MPDWDDIPDRWRSPLDKDGNPIKFTREQIGAMQHYFRVWQEVAGGSYSTLEMAFMKSRLLGRLFFEGKPPHKNPPPLHTAGGWWELVEEGKCAFGSFSAPKVYEHKGGTKYLSGFGFSWNIVEELGEDTYIVDIHNADGKWLYRPVRDEEESLQYECGSHYDPETCETTPMFATHIVERIEDDD